MTNQSAVEWITPSLGEEEVREATVDRFRGYSGLLKRLHQLHFKAYCPGCVPRWDELIWQGCMGCGRISAAHDGWELRRFTVVHPHIQMDYSHGMPVEQEIKKDTYGG